jgi:hypothetical protein
VAARFGNVLFVIHAADCACIADAAAHRHEREVLFLPRSIFVILRVTRDSFGGAEIELRDVYTDADFARGLTPAEARPMALSQLRVEVGADRADQLIDQPEGIAAVNRCLRYQLRRRSSMSGPLRSSSLRGLLIARTLDETKRSWLGNGWRGSGDYAMILMCSSLQRGLRGKRRCGA